MADPVVLPVGASVGIIAFLLSLLPAGFFLWVWYLRNRDKTLSGWAIAAAFALGAFVVLPSFYLEQQASALWHILSPSTEHFFSGAVSLISFQDILLPAFATFLIIAPVEEGLRYIGMRLWMSHSNVVDQVFDGLLIGVAVGLGFATAENTLYFHTLLQTQEYDTLVFVFLLRFVISTLAHISFAGIMGTLIARGSLSIFHSNRYYVPAFFIPWFLHGLFNLLLGTGKGMFAVVLLLPALLILTSWAARREFAIVHRQDGKFLEKPHVPQSPEMQALSSASAKEDSPWNKHAPWLTETKSYRTMFNALKNNS